MSAHEREKQKEKDKTVLSFTETNLACFIIPYVDFSTPFREAIYS